MKYLALFLFFLPACNTPTAFLNAITPDSISVGQSNGSIGGMADIKHGWGYPDGKMEADFDSEATVLFLSWDLPKWTDGTLDADADRYMRERIRHLNYRIHMMEEEEKNNRLIDDWLDMKR